MTKIAIYQGLVPDASTQLHASDRPGAIHAAVACNTTGADATLTIWLAMNGAAAAVGNMLYNAVLVPANSSVNLANLPNHSLPTGAKLYAQASAANTIALTVSGVE